MTPHVPVDDPRPGLPDNPGYHGLFAQPGALVRTPGGNVEDVARYKQAGVRWLLLNLEHPLTAWGPLPAKCNTAGMPWGWWFHCREREAVEWLLDESVRYRRPIVGINVEAELATTLTPAVIRQLVDDSGYTGEVATILYGWVQNGVVCSPIGHWPALLECFPADAPALWDAATQTVKWHDCETHARQLGLRHPMLLMQCYRGRDGVWPQPDWYPDVQPRHAFALDDITGEGGPPEKWFR